MTLMKSYEITTRHSLEETTSGSKAWKCNTDYCKSKITIANVLATGCKQDFCWIMSKTECHFTQKCEEYIFTICTAMSENTVFFDYNVSQSFISFYVFVFWICLKSLVTKYCGNINFNMNNTFNDVIPLL